MSNIIKIENIEGLILVIRGQRVILDADIAVVYGVETKRINEAVKNNPDKFPQGYFFELDATEYADLRSKISTAKYAKTRVTPKAFTEKGLYMLATILKSQVATQATLKHTIKKRPGRKKRMSTITVTHLGKAYKQYPTRWSRLAEWLDPRGKPRHHLHWALQDVSFTVHPGEAVGIIGVNGAGKSTLLKMITGTTQPTTGSVNITGRVAALLELGMGFHPDFTGRQNAFMAGQLLGYSVEKIAALMSEIEAFAEIGDYIDQPVRVYSSGMQVRLAFAVATAVRPDVLIVDEALSVGDAYFQAKCYQRINQFKEEGSTLLLVSHSPGDVVKHCERVGGVPVQSKTGHAFIKERMRSENAIYGGEMSAHHYFRDFAYCDSGMIPWLLVAELLSRSGKKLSQLVGERICAYPCGGEINYHVHNVPQTIERVLQHYLNPSHPALSLALQVGRAKRGAERSVAEGEGLESNVRGGIRSSIAPTA